MTGAAYVPPFNPGPLPPGPVAGANPQQAAHLLEQYCRNKYMYDYHNNVDMALKKQWEQCIEPAFLAALRHPITGLSGRSAWNIIGILVP